MKYDKLINFYLKEGVYTQKRSGILSGGTKLGSKISIADEKKANDYLKKKFIEFYKDPTNVSVIRDILATLTGMDSVSVMKNNQTKKEFLGQMLIHIFKKTGMNVSDIIPKGQEGSNGKELTIDQWKVKHGAGSELMYNVLRDILNSEEYNIATKGRNVREAEGGDQIEVFYFSEEGDPIRTTVFVDAEGKAPRGAFWSSNRFNKKKAPYVGFKPTYFRGADIETIKQAVKHDDAKTAFEKKYPRKEFPSMYSFGGKKKEKSDVPLMQSIKPQPQTA